MVRALVVGWVGLTRPGELLRLRRRDVVLPSDLGEIDTVAFIVYVLPKGRWSRRAPKQEHVRVDEDGHGQGLVLEVLEELRRHLRHEVHERVLVPVQ